ncbi:hypothetical protein [Photobacterium leiognathi]|uniref:Uncharacterized protein n=1 Tax=Photobacterium leiognathi TaxID=553611 RepID=A0A2T3MEQ9_PHOLE|nr:hypothetical protein [Photobacterium leiognathi]KJF98101.1 hypothetical protein UB34_09620 [Photobacterium leiognathi]PSV92283.1 hypothetical protein CTM89_04910 [Photobacterium leiognathi]
MLNDLLWFVPFIALFLIFNLFIRKRRSLRRESSFSALKNRIFSSVQAMRDVEDEVEDDETEAEPEPPVTTKKAVKPKPAKKPRKLKPEEHNNAQIDGEHWLHEKAKRTRSKKAQ